MGSIANAPVSTVQRTNHSSQVAILCTVHAVQDLHRSLMGYQHIVNGTVISKLNLNRNSPGAVSGSLGLRFHGHYNK